MTKVDGGFRVEMNFPILRRLKYDADKVMNACGRAISTSIKKRLKDESMGAKGRLHNPRYKGSEMPLQNTGALLKSIGYSTRTKVVSAKGDHPSGGAPLNKKDKRGRNLRNGAILGMQIAAKGGKNRSADPMGLDEESVKKANRAIERTMNRQERSGEMGLLAENRKFRKGLK